MHEWTNKPDLEIIFFGLSTNVVVNASELIHNKSHLIRSDP